MKTMRVPRVMANRATHLYLGWLVRGGEAPFVADRKASIPCRRRARHAKSITLTSG